MTLRIDRLITLLALLVLVTFSAHAQNGVIATLTTPDTDAFPQTYTCLDIHDNQGKFVHGLQKSDVDLIEDGKRVLINEFEEIKPGVQIVFALNPGHSFTIRDSQGVSRQDILFKELTTWADSRKDSTVDDISLIITGNPAVSHVSNSSDAFLPLETYKINESSPGSSIDTLFQAFEIASDQPPRSHMKRIILFITSPMGGDVSLGLQNLKARAIQQNVSIFIWWIAPSDQSNTPAANSLFELSAQTGGEFFTFSGAEVLPSIENFLEPKRYLYQVGYASHVSTSGTHNLGMEILLNEEIINTPAQEFSIDLQLPDPAFILPPAEIVRQVPANQKSIPWNITELEDLVPKEQILQILVSFPDGHNRPLSSTRLFVDGKITDENTEPPYLNFTWDLRNYSNNGQHLVRVEVQDSLGKVGSTIETVVNVKVDHPKPSLLGILFQDFTRTLVLTGLLIAAIVLLLLLISGKIHPGRKPLT